MVRCAVPNCKSHLKKASRYFCLPRAEDRRNEWIKFSQRDPSTFDPTKQYRFCDLHFDESQYELNRQDKWKKLKPNAIPTINFPPTDEILTETQKIKNEDFQNSNTACHIHLEHDLPKRKSRRSRRQNTQTTSDSYASTSKARKVHSNLLNELTANEFVEEIFIDLENGNEELSTDGIAANMPVSSETEIQELRMENEKLRKENEQLRITVVKMQRILERRRFTYLNVKALLQNKDKALIFKNKKS